MSQASFCFTGAGPEGAAAAQVGGNERLHAVLTVIYLVFTEGYAATRGVSLVRTDLSAEAIRLARLVHGLTGGAPPAEVTGLLDTLRDRRPGFDYTIRDLFEVRPTQTSPDAPIVRSTAAAIERVLGRVAEHVVSPGTYDQKHIDRIGRVRNCVAYGPGILDLAHQPDEWVGIRDMVDAAKVMAIGLDLLLRGTAR